MLNPRAIVPSRLLAALLLATGGVAHAQDAAEPLTRLRAVAEQAVRRTLPATAEVSADALDPRLRLPACARAPEAVADDARGARVSVTVRCAAPQAWTLYVPVQVRDLRAVPVLVRAVRRGEAIDAGLFRSEQRDVAQLPFGYLEQLAANPQAYQEREFRRPLAAGQAPGPDDLAPQRCIRRGDLVTLIGRAAGIEVRTDGKALADGARGDRIQVQNPRSRRVVQAVVTGPGVVETLSADAPATAARHESVEATQVQSVVAANGTENASPGETLTGSTRQ